MADEITKVDPSFDSDKFIKLVFDSVWESRELKQRFRHISVSLHEVLNMEYPEALELLKKLTGRLKGWAEFVMPDYVEVYGLNDFAKSMKALEIFTQHSTGEFAIRPFLIKYPDKTIKQMLVWSKHKNEHVRRFSSEGCRPRLPWGMGVPWLKKDPSGVIEILENLKNDNSEYVRKSVANNLNDISKDHPVVVIGLAKRWIGKSERTDWILKHGCRTLLKKGDSEALSLFGVIKSAKIRIDNLCMLKTKVRLGETTQFEFDAILEEKKKCVVRLEYRIDYKNASGGYSKKIFKIGESEMNPGEKKHYKRKISFIDLTIRKHYPGKHKLTVIANGKGVKEIVFNLI